MFYATFAIAGNEFYQWAKVRGEQHYGSIPENPKENALKTA